ncbi:2OG-Fe(II) oxygenase [Alkalicaulis satelles]|uniref:2OG-Fe(II) oxygenase n=1 Tax=Alkalicaulis satelles TaxID=2609175 RepID=A0A5M6ZKT7_9PROT|nr:2OG-Fe(II) oxygenase [Alkalicaulis satelles]KAA5805433.1 2OG-Fe(II) oxygenase [Alkalicaulis satelles]
MHQSLATPRPLFGDNLTASLIAGLEAHGWAHAPGALDDELTAALRAEALVLDETGETHAGAVGRGRHEQHDRSIRRTRIAWLDGASPAQTRFLEGAEALRRSLNRALYLGLFEFEAHYAVYPPGGFYARHLDAFTLPAAGAGAGAGLGRRAERSRVVSLVAYLNDHWEEGHGGRLALWERAPMGADARPDMAALDDVTPAAEIAPAPGGLVLMLSESIPHEVRPAFAPRIAIAGWFRVNASVGGALDPAR